MNRPYSKRYTAQSLALRVRARFNGPANRDPGLAMRRGSRRHTTRASTTQSSSMSATTSPRAADIPCHRMRGTVSPAGALSQRHPLKRSANSIISEVIDTEGANNQHLRVVRRSLLDERRQAARQQRGRAEGDHDDGESRTGRPTAPSVEEPPAARAGPSQVSPTLTGRPDAEQQDLQRRGGEQHSSISPLSPSTPVPSATT